MRRKDREIKSIEQIFDILTRCDTIRIGIQGEINPYVVPVSFGAELLNGKVIIYFHCAKQRMKIDLLKNNAHVCMESDIFLGVEKTLHGITTRYESVIGLGECQLLDDHAEIIHGLKVLTEHYGYHDYPLDQCRELKHLHVGKIVLDEIFGKQNLSGTPTSADVSILK